MLKNELYHHGILGQKWGKRNGPPYPLRPSAHSASEKKAGYEKSIKSNKSVKDLGKQKVGMIIPLPAPAYYAVQAVKLVTKAVENPYQDWRDKTKIPKEKAMAKNVHGEASIPKKTSERSAKQDLRDTNPKRHLPGPGYSKNCMYCSVVYDLRRRGYDVTANKREYGGPPDEIETWYKNAKVSYCDRSSLREELLKQPTGSRGSLMLQNKHYGHSIAYEIYSNKKGEKKINFLDAQHNTKYSWFDLLDIQDRKLEAGYVRLDDKEPDWDKIGQCIDPKSLKKK